MLAGLLSSFWLCSRGGCAYRVPVHIASPSFHFLLIFLAVPSLADCTHTWPPGLGWLLLSEPGTAVEPSSPAGTWIRALPHVFLPQRTACPSPYPREARAVAPATPPAQPGLRCLTALCLSFLICSRRTIIVTSLLESCEDSATVCVCWGGAGEKERERETVFRTMPDISSQKPISIGYYYELLHPKTGNHLRFSFCSKS